MRFNPGWKLSVMVVVLLPMLISLGHWQTQRAAQKRDILQRIEQRRSVEPVTLTMAQRAGDLAYRQVALRGRYLGERVILLDNRIVQGRFGYEWVQLFRSSGGEVFAISRGWVAGSLRREQLPSLPRLDGEVGVAAEVYVPLGDALQLDDEPWPPGWPKRVQTLNLDALAEELGEPVFPYLLRLHEGNAGFLQACWQDINVLPAKHTAYAVQWYAMAVALLLMYLGVGFSLVGPKRSGSDKSAGSGEADS